MQPSRDTLRTQRLKDVAGALRKAYSAEPANVPEYLKTQLQRIKEAGARENLRKH